MKKTLGVSFVLLCSGVSSIATAQVAYTEETRINSGGGELSGFLGRNNEATGDAAIGDINLDGYLDIFDANSTLFDAPNPSIRFNNSDGSGFTEQFLNEGASLSTFDADLADLNNDGYVDLIRAEFDGDIRQVSVYLNLRQAPWFSLSSPSYQLETTFCPIDIDVVDVNKDGFLDFAIGQTVLGFCFDSGTGRANVLLNNGDGTFNTSIPEIVAYHGVSSHDVFFIDANNDGHQDLFVVNENGPSKLYLNSGESLPAFTEVKSTSFSAGFSGEAEDFNDDGLMDIVIGADGVTNVYINDPQALGNFVQVASLPNRFSSNAYDVELEDFDSDGDVDIATISNSFGSPTLWLNDGESLPLFTQQLIDPDRDAFELNTIDAIDFDVDGDLDIYVAGGTFTLSQGCFGCVSNQFYSAITLPNDFYTNFENGIGVWTQLQDDTIDWRPRTAQTSSGNTGPFRAATGRTYYYFETSSGSANSAGNTAILESPVLTAAPNRYVVFDYHAYGADIGSLHVDVLADGTLFESVWSVSGQQQLDETNPWLTARVNLSEFIGDIQVRIRAEAAGGFLGDIAIDNLSVLNVPPNIPSVTTINVLFDDVGLGDFIGLGDLVAVIDGQSEFICTLADNPGGCIGSVVAPVGTPFDLVVEVPEEAIPFISSFWDGCDSTEGGFICNVTANGLILNLTYFQF